MKRYQRRGVETYRIGLAKDSQTLENGLANVNIHRVLTQDLAENLYATRSNVLKNDASKNDNELGND